jgi:hypothetical protein
MKARRFVGAASFGPDVLKVLFKAFDDAWEEIGPGVSNRANAVNAARLQLASIILKLANADTLDAGQLKNEALRIFRSKGRISVRSSTPG